MGEDNRDPWFVFRDLPCLGCGYNLRAQTGPDITCPECGKLQDVSDPRQWMKEGDEFVRGRVYRYMHASVCFCMTIVPLFGIFSRDSPSFAVLTLGFMFLLFFFVFVGSAMRLIKKERRAGTIPFDIGVGFGVAVLIPCIPVAIVSLTSPDQTILEIPTPLLVLPGLAISFGLFLLLRRQAPDKHLGIPEKLHYCDAIKHREVLDEL